MSRTAAIFSHVKAGRIILKIEKDINKVISEKKKLKDALFTINLIEKRCEEVSEVISKERSIIKTEISRTNKFLYRYGFFSRIIKQVRKFICRKYFSMKEKEHIRNLFLKVESYIKVLDLKIIDENGNPIN